MHGVCKTVLSSSPASSIRIFDMAPSIPYQSPDAAIAQDAFDAKLNQTIFVIALVVGGFIQATALLYLCFWLIRKSRARKPPLDTTQEKRLPKQLLLPSRAELSASAPKRLILSTLSTPRFDRTPSGSEDRTGSSRTQTWRLPSPENPPILPAISLHDENFSIYPPDWKPKGALASSSPDSPLYEVDLGTSDSDALTVGSISTVVEIIEPTGFAPRIVVEDFAPAASKAFFSDANDSDTESDMSIDDEKIDTSLLVVPPMSWMAPRDLVEDRDRAQQCLTSPSKTVKKSRSMSSMLSIFSDISNVARLRPKLSTSISGTFATKTTPKYSTARMSARSVGRMKENASIRTP